MQRKHSMMMASLIVSAAALAFGGPASAATITLDELANDLVGGGTPAGQPITFANDTVLGSLVLCEGAANAAGTACAANVALSDVISWFTGIGGVTIFASLTSDKTEVENNSADSVNLDAPEGALYMAERVVTTAAGDTFEGAIYTPAKGQPGFSATGNYTYNINSDPIPEPTSVALLLTGLVGLGVSRRRLRG